MPLDEPAQPSRTNGAGISNRNIARVEEIRNQVRRNDQARFERKLQLRREFTDGDRLALERVQLSQSPSQYLNLGAPIHN